MAEEKSKVERLKDQLTELEREGEPIQKTLESFMSKTETEQDLRRYGFFVGYFGQSKLLAYELKNGSTYQWLEGDDGNYEFLQHYQKTRRYRQT